MILTTINKALINYIPTERKIANYLLWKIKGEKTETRLKCSWRLHVVHENESVFINLIVCNYRSVSHFHLLPPDQTGSSIPSPVVLTSLHPPSNRAGLLPPHHPVPSHWHGLVQRVS